MLIRRTSIGRRVWRHVSTWGGSLLTNGENMRKQRHVLALVIGAGLTAACLLAAEPMAASDQGSWPASKVSAPAPKVAGMPAALAKNLANFDDLDFHVYTGQQWENLHKSHAQDIVVHYPDGHTTKGIPDHIKELKFMWTGIPLVVTIRVMHDDVLRMTLVKVLPLLPGVDM